MVWGAGRLNILSGDTTLNSRSPFLFAIVLIAWFSAIQLSGCGYLFTPDPGIGRSINWNDLDGWEEDNLQQAWQAIQSQCPRMASKNPDWVGLCKGVSQLDKPGSAEVREFIEQHFKPHKIHAKHGKREGLITGYYEPLLNGSLEQSDRYPYPIYTVPDDMLTIDLAEIYPSLEGMRLRGRLEGNKVVPFHPRKDIDGEQQPLAGKELLWIDDPHDSFFLQIQGSGRVRLDDGKIMGLDYADQNGHPYFAVGRKLVEMGELEVEEVSLFTIRAWLKDNPSRADELLNTNPSYVFFTLREDSSEAARGSLNVPLTSGRSLAVDKSVIPLGTLVWLDTSLPDGSSYRRLMVAQDTGGAISGAVRADVFFGAGEDAEQLAGEMKQKGRLFALLPSGT